MHECVNPYVNQIGNRHRIDEARHPELPALRNERYCAWRSWKKGVAFTIAPSCL